MLNFNSHCQTNYFNPNLYCRYLLDSLNIPYLPMKLRGERRIRAVQFKKYPWQHFHLF